MNGKVEIVSGTLGGGKSLYAVETLYGHLQKGGYVYTNIEINVDAVADRLLKSGYVFDPKRLVKLSSVSLRGFHTEIARGIGSMCVMVVLDEAHLEWNARDYQKARKDETTKEMLNFVTLVRKLDIHLVFITQDSADIDKQIRKKVSTLVFCRNLKKLRIGGLIPCPIPIMVRVFYDVSVGNAKPIMLYQDIFMSRKWVYPLYNSDALLGESAALFESLPQVEGGALNRSETTDEERRRAIDQLLIIFACIISVFFYSFW